MARVLNIDIYAKNKTPKDLNCNTNKPSVSAILVLFLNIKYKPTEKRTKKIIRGSKNVFSIANGGKLERYFNSFGKEINKLNDNRKLKTTLIQP